MLSMPYDVYVELFDAVNGLGVEIENLQSDNAKLRELVADFDKCLDTALYLASDVGYPVMPDQKLFDSLRLRMLELGVEEGK